MMNKSMRGFSSALVVAALVFVGASGAGWAQTFGTILGNVSDPSGNVIVGAKVTLTNEGTVELRTANTDQAGSFSFPSLQPGSYTVKVESTGFQKV